MTITSVRQFLTPEQITLAKRLGDDAKQIRTLVIQPNIEVINQKLGQKNDPMYLSYLVVYLLGDS